MYLHKMRGVRIERTAVAKSKSGMIIIGEEASHQREWAINFVQSPRCWNKIFFNGITHKEYRPDFIRGISETEEAGKIFQKQNVISVGSMCTVEGLVKMEQKDYAVASRTIQASPGM